MVSSVRIGELIELTHSRPSLTNATDQDTADINEVLREALADATNVPPSELPPAPIEPPANLEPTEEVEA